MFNVNYLLHLTQWWEPYNLTANKPNETKQLKHLESKQPNLSICVSIMFPGWRKETESSNC